MVDFVDAVVGKPAVKHVLKFAVGAEVELEQGQLVAEVPSFGDGERHLRSFI